MPKQIVFKPLEDLQKIYKGGELTPPKFMPTYLEWLWHQGTRIIIDGDVSNSTTTVYTVPVGSYFFITGLNIYINCVQADRECIVILGGQDYFIYQSANATTEQAIPIIFQIPFKLNPKETVKIYSNSANIRLGIVVIGFLVNQNVLI